jgi:hypothetical protein
MHTQQQSSLIKGKHHICERANIQVAVTVADLRWQILTHVREHCEYQLVHFLISDLHAYSYKAVERGLYSKRVQTKIKLSLFLTKHYAMKVYREMDV